jgi:hypothetical protein
LKRPDGQQISLNAMTSKPHSVSKTEPYLGILGDEHELETTSDMSLISTKKLVRMIKRDLLVDAFLLLIQHDDSLKGISEMKILREQMEHLMILLLSMFQETLKQRRI